MTPELPPPSGDHPKRPRSPHTPGKTPLEQQAEEELWDFDSPPPDTDLPPPPAAPSQPAPPAEHVSGIPTERIPPRVNRNTSFTVSSGRSAARGTRKEKKTPVLLKNGVESTFDELDEWDDIPDAPAPAADPPAPTSFPEPPALTPAADDDIPAATEPAVEESTALPAVDDSPATPGTPPAAALSYAEEEESHEPPDASDPSAAAAKGFPRFSLTVVEKISIVSFAVLLLFLVAFFFVHSFHKIPIGDSLFQSIDYPVKGSHVTIAGATSYWREPVLSGDNPDSVRRGTVLIPVIELKVKGTGAIRVFFRNEEGQIVGDAVTRTLNGETTLSLPATAGFDDYGMHAGYRTKQDGRWTIQVFESASGQSGRDRFTKILELPVSTDLR